MRHYKRSNLGAEAVERTQLVGNGRFGTVVVGPTATVPMGLGIHAVEPSAAIHANLGLPEVEPGYRVEGLGIHAIEPGYRVEGLGIHAVEPGYRVAPGFGAPVVEPWYQVPSGLGIHAIEPGYRVEGLGQDDAAVAEVLRQFVDVERGQARSLRMIAIWTSVMGALTAAGVTASILIAFFGRREHKQMREEYAAEAEA